MSAQVLRLSLLGLLIPVTVSAAAQPWEFGPAIPVTRDTDAQVFHHLESAGRRNLALSADSIAVIWEDNRNGHPEVYVAFRRGVAPGFSAASRVSGGGDAFEPVIAGLGARRFLMAWEEDGHIHARSGSVSGLDPAVRVSENHAAQASVAAAGGGAWLAWSEQRARYPHIRMARVTAQKPGQPLQVGGSHAVDDAAPRNMQLYPALAAVDGSVVVAWEDRRHGHTRLYYRRSADGVRFTPLQALNETGPRRSSYGAGTGVARVALALAGRSGVVAAWSDKRDFLSGYDVYAALSRDGGRSFGPNEKVQDVFGSAITQWHPGIAADRAGTIVVAWDDDREETPDIWLSWRTLEGWSEDLAVPGASGDGEQVHPVIALDAAGNLHLAWLERARAGGKTRILYSFGRRQRSLR